MEASRSSSELFGLQAECCEDYSVAAPFATDMNYGHPNLLLQQQQRYLASPDIPVTVSDRAQVRLLSLLKDIGAPLNAYGKVMDWAAECFNDGYKFPISYPTRDKVLAQLFDEFDLME